MNRHHSHRKGQMGRQSEPPSTSRGPVRRSELRDVGSGPPLITEILINSRAERAALLRGIRDKLASKCLSSGSNGGGQAAPPLPTSQLAGEAGAERGHLHRQVIGFANKSGS